MAELQRIEFTEEETQAMNLAAGYTPEVPAPEEVVTETQEVIDDNQEIIITEQETPVEEPVIEEPQLIIQEPELIPQVETQQPEVVLPKVKAKAYNTQLVAALNKYVASVENPDPEAFVKKYLGTYENLSPIEIIRQGVISSMVSSNPRASVIEKKVQQELSRLGVFLESDDPEERADSEQILQEEAETVKARMIKSNKEFVSQFESDLEIEFDAPQVPQPPVPTEEDIRAQREALEAQYLPEVSKFVRNGVIQIKDKDGVVNIPAVDQAEYINSLVDPVEFIRSIAFNPDGTPNYGKWIQFVTAAKNINSYNSTMIKHGIAIGQDKLASKIKNEAPLVNPRGTDPNGVIKTPKDDPQGFIAALDNIRPYVKN